MLELLPLHQYSQIITLIFVIAIQVYRLRLDQSSKFWACLKVIFNFQVFKIYMIVVIYELKQIHDYKSPDFQPTEKIIFLGELENNLFYLSLFVYVGVLYLLLFLRTLQQNNVKLKHLPNLSYIQVIQYGFRALIQTLFAQIISFLLILYIHQRNPYDLYKFYQISYIKMLFLLSAISSMDPIIQILIQAPMSQFFKSYNMLTLDEMQPLEYQYVQLNKTEYCDNFQEYPLNNTTMLNFEEEDVPQSVKSKKQSIKQVCYKLKRAIRYLLVCLYFIYCFVQMLFAFLILVALICIFIQTLNPKTNLLVYLNAVDFFDSGESRDTDQKIQTIGYFLFKVMFVIIMYFSSQDCIKYKQRKDIINDVNNIVVIVRKSLLNFSLIGLLTTLYPNLTMTINNTDCFKNISYKSGEYIQDDQSYRWNESECPVTIMGLLTMKIFESRSALIVGLMILVLYISYSAYMVARVAVKRKQQ